MISFESFVKIAIVFEHHHSGSALVCRMASCSAASSTPNSTHNHAHTSAAVHKLTISRVKTKLITTLRSRSLCAILTCSFVLFSLTLFDRTDNIQHTTLKNHI